MHSEAWGDPRDPREHRGGHRMRMRMRGGPGGGPGPWGGGPFEFGMRGGPFGPPRFGGRGPRVRRGDPAGYQSHLLYAEPDGAFSISAMVWLPGQQTMIHDHVAWCVTAVLQGREYEEIFALADGGRALRLVARNVNQAGAVSGFAPPGDIHRVRNSGDTVAISMHVYGADISRLGNSIRREYPLPVRA